jgi:5-methylcytosine-specific restriction enzyme subunit McrC
MVGVVAGEGCSLEILPKVDPDSADGETDGTVRTRLVRMLDVALGLDLVAGPAAEMERQDDTLLDVLIRVFADGLLAQVHRGLPRRYLGCEDDLPALRGRLDVARQFTRNAVRPDRLACRFDQLDPDTPLMRVMTAAVVFLSGHARSEETQRRLVELRHTLADIPLVPVARLPWDAVRIDRSNRRWGSLFALAKLLLKRDWQDIGHEGGAAEGITLLFPMNDLFEAFIAALARRALAARGVEVTSQSGGLFCLGPHTGDHLVRGTLFRTWPDLILRGRDGRVRAIIDTKWKKLAADPLAKKHGVAQGDVYQMMAYARLYGCRELMLLYPAIPGAQDGCRTTFGMVGGRERLSIAEVDVALDEADIVGRLGSMVGALL